MMILHDIWVNWLEGGSRAYSIPEYHEWRKNDNVELIDTIPLVKVEPELFSILEDDYVTIPKALLEQVHGVARKLNKETNRKRKIEYCFVITDGSRILVIDTEGDDKPNLKSRVAPRNETSILDTAEDMMVYSFEIPQEVLEDNELDDSLMGRLLAFDPSYFIGLTRAEKEMKEILFDCLFNLSCSTDFHEVRYWYKELFPKEVTPDPSYGIDWAIENMFNFIKQGWSKRHEEFGSQLMKFHDLYRDEWIELVKRNKQTDKVNM